TCVLGSFHFRGGEMVRLGLARWLGLGFGVTSITFLMACGGGSSAPPPQIAVIVHPKAASVVAGSQQQQFSAAVSNDSQNRGVTWSVDTIAGGSASIGTISATGLYTPPPAGGSHTITATSIGDTSKH